MRNKPYITFIINILIGIIFILPVYSISGNQFDLTSGSDNLYITEKINTDNTILSKSNSPQKTLIETYSAVIPHQLNFSKQHKIVSDNQGFSKFVYNSGDFHNIHFRNISLTHGSNIFLKNISSLKSLMTVRILC